MALLKIKIKSLQSWETSAGTPSMMRPFPQVSRAYWLTGYMLICLFACLFVFWKYWRNVSLTWLMLFVVTRYKAVWKPCFYGAVPQTYLRGCLWGYSPQFGSNKTLFYSYYSWLLITYIKNVNGWGMMLLAVGVIIPGLFTLVYRIALCGVG